MSGEPKALFAAPSCRMCGTTEGLTKHHLLKRKSAAIIGRNMTVKLCRSCHDRLHKGAPNDRDQAWKDLPMTYEESMLRSDPRRLQELWETRVTPYWEPQLTCVRCGRSGEPAHFWGIARVGHVCRDEVTCAIAAGAREVST